MRAVSEGFGSLSNALANEQFDFHDVAFRARALAQAHALTEAAHSYRQWRISRDEAEHPFPELSTWAATAFLTGYCVRCVEESLTTDVAEAREEDEPSDGGVPSSLTLQGVRPAVGDFAPWEIEAAKFVNELPRNSDLTLLAHQVVLAALDDVVSREIDKRAEHVKEQVLSTQWSEFEDFIGWWTLHGYAIRAVE